MAPRYTASLAEKGEGVWESEVFTHSYVRQAMVNYQLIHGENAYRTNYTGPER
jgi:hypothetical protein